MSSLVTESKEKMATRDGYGRALESLGGTRNFIVMCADLSDSVRTIYFQKKFPDRFIECGIAEANMM
ncbi:MAG: transketolase family protein, partial [Clostridia bacterium]|nr:transketolase family protein [Clostridia bacterium]